MSIISDNKSFRFCSLFQLMGLVCRRSHCFATDAEHFFFVKSQLNENAISFKIAANKILPFYLMLSSSSTSLLRFSLCLFLSFRHFVRNSEKVTDELLHHFDAFAVYFNAFP